MPRKYWLFKTEPGAYSFDDLVSDGVGEWDGVRNFQARNYLRDEVQEGDLVLFYHSNTKPLAIVGVARVVRAGYPNHTAWAPDSEHPDPKSTPDNPLWYMVDVAPEERFTEPVTMEQMRATPELQDMLLLQRSRLSIQPVTEEQFQTIRATGKPRPVGQG